MADLHLIRPWWLLAIPAGLALLHLAWRADERVAPWRRVCDQSLLPHLLATTRRRSRFPVLLAGLAVSVAVLALAGPSWSRITQPVYHDVDAVVVVLDLSRSMDAGDLAPSRLARARFKVADLLERARGKQTGLVVFAGDAFVVAPLTDDVATLTNLLPALSTDLMPVHGSRPDLGLAAAARLLDGASAGDGVVVLVSDGADEPRAPAEAARLRAAGFRVSVLAVGSAQGAPVPLPDGGFLRDADGNIVVPGLDAQGLATIAGAGGGELTSMTADDTDLELLLGQAAGPPGAGARALDRTTQRWLDQGPWLVLALLPLGALAFRRGWLAVGLVCTLGIPVEPALAFDWQSMWARSDQRAARALREGAATRAAVTAGAKWRAPARYRQGEYDQAASDYAQLSGPRSDYNRGNALARAGRLEEALAAYDRALEARSEMADAIHNRALVERLLRASPPPASGAGGQAQPEAQTGPPGESSTRTGPQEGAPRPEDGASSDAGSDEGSGSRSRRPDGGARDERQAGAEPPEDGADDRRRADNDDEPRDGTGPGALEARAETPLDAERRQAMEQWLRRIPDDPGGLLRRKFALEHGRRGVRDDGPAGVAW